jgi:phosphate transport system permease protein
MEISSSLPSQVVAPRYIRQSKAGYRKRKTTNIILLGITGFLTLLALVPLFWIIGYVIYQGSQSINLGFFTQTPRPMGMAGGGVLHAIEGTLLLTLISSIFAIPPGVLAGFYAAYNPNTPLGTALRFGTDVLSGVPSIVIGIFGYALFVKPFGHYSGLAGALVLAIIMLPTIVRTVEEMLKLVPHTLREGSLSLGAPEWRTALKVTLPAALDGIITGVMLAVARASGETAPLLFTALGNDHFEAGRMIQSGIQNQQNIFSILFNIIQQPVDSLPLTLYKYSQQPYPERISQSWGVALVLMFIVLIINVFARVMVEVRSSKNRGH